MASLENLEVFDAKKDKFGPKTRLSKAKKIAAASFVLLNQITQGKKSIFSQYSSFVLQYFLKNVLKVFSYCFCLFLKYIF